MRSEVILYIPPSSQVFHSGVYPPREIKMSLSGYNYIPKSSGKPLSQSNFEPCMEELLCE